MRFGRFFWGGMLILAGIFLLLDNLQLFSIDVWDAFWPLVLVLLGLSLLVQNLTRKEESVESLAIERGDAAKARLHLKHGAGHLFLGSGAAEGRLLVGDFNNGVEYHTRREGSTLDVTLRPLSNRFGFPFSGIDPFDWDIRLNPNVLLDLDLETGAAESDIDLSALLVSDLRLRTGASSTHVTLPAAAGYTEVDLRTGVSSVDFTVPKGVAASIRASGGLASVEIDQQRFPRRDGFYQSPNFEDAENRVALHIETGVGSVRVR